MIGRLLNSRIAVLAFVLALGMTIGAGGMHALGPTERVETAHYVKQAVPISGLAEKAIRAAEKARSGGSALDLEDLTFQTQDPYVPITTGVTEEAPVDSTCTAVPASLLESCRVASSNPLDIQEETVQYRAWNPRTRQIESRIYEVPDAVFALELEAAAMGGANLRHLAVPVGVDVSWRPDWGEIDVGPRYFPLLPTGERWGAMVTLETDLFTL